MDYISKSNTRNINVRYSYNRYNTFNSNYIYSNIYDDFSDSYDLSFFFKQFEKHYKQLNDTVFRPLFEIRSEGSGLVDSIKIDVYIPPNQLLKSAKWHMEKDCHGLSKDIDDIITIISNHNSKVYKFDKLIDDVKDISFTKPISSPLSYNNKYEIDHDNIKNLSTSIWNAVYHRMIQGMTRLTDLQNFKSQLQSIDIIRTQNMEKELWLNNRRIGKGKDSDEIDNMERIFKNVYLNNQNILSKLVEIINEKFSIETEIISQVKLVLNENFSNLIENGPYTTKTKCCPTFLNLFQRFFL